MTMEEAMELADSVFDEIISFQLLANRLATSFHPILVPSFTYKWESVLVSMR